MPSVLLRAVNYTTRDPPSLPQARAAESRERPDFWVATYVQPSGGCFQNPGFGGVPQLTVSPWATPWGSQPALGPFL